MATTSSIEERIRAFLHLSAFYLYGCDCSSVLSDIHADNSLTDAMNLADGSGIEGQYPAGAEVS